VSIVDSLRDAPQIHLRCAALHQAGEVAEANLSLILWMHSTTEGQLYALEHPDDFHFLHLIAKEILDRESTKGVYLTKDNIACLIRKQTVIKVERIVLPTCISPFEVL